MGELGRLGFLKSSVNGDIYFCTVRGFQIKELSMNRLTYCQVTIVFLLGLAFISPMTIAKDKNWPTAAVSNLFVEGTGGGIITGSDDQHLTLTLTRPRNYVTAFTDRPIRKAEALSNVAFFNFWPKEFAGGPPNVVLIYRLQGQPQPLNTILTLTNPLYDTNNTIAFDGGTDSPNLGCSGAKFFRNTDS
jgi:hypothetical protein